jgi:hypothetical protein
MSLNGWNTTTTTTPRGGVSGGYVR